MFGSNFRFGGMPQRPSAPGSFGGGAPMGGAGRSAGMFGGGAPRQAMGGFGQMGQRAQMAPRPGGPAGFGQMAGQAQQRVAQPRPPGMAGQMSGMMGAAGGMLSDEESKTKIRELEDELSKTYAALGGKSATADVSEPIRLRQQMGRALDQGAISSREQQQLDEAFRKPSSNSYEYRDPQASGAGPGRFAGPMADELKGIPGVVEQGPDGLDRVNTPRLELANTSEIANLRREMDALMGKVNTGNSNPDGTF